MSTSVGGIRIVDMPDLGVVTDDSSVVGEHAGSGRFSMLALRDYAGGRGIINVLDKGAKGDGLTDDTAAIQAALNTYAGKATVFIPDTGLQYYCSQLVVPSGTDLLINGLVRGKPGSTSHLVYVNAASNVRIRGSGTLDGNNRDNPYPGSSGGTLFILSSTNVQVSGLTIGNAPLWPIVAQQSSRVLLSGLAISGGRNSSGFSVSCDDCWLMNSTIIGPDDDIGFAFYGGVTNSGAIGNTVKNSGNVGSQSAVGLIVLADTAQTAACSNIVISGNVVTHCGGSGIAVTSITSNYHDGVVISNNRCYQNGIRPIGSRGDYDINGATNVLVSGNSSGSFGGTSTDSWFGLTAGMIAPASGISFIGNHVYNVGQGISHAGYGLYVNSVPDLMASGNFFYDNQPSPTTAGSISGVVGARNAFIGNYCEQPISLVAQADTILANVVGGVWSFGSGLGPASLTVQVNGVGGHPAMLEFAVNGTPRWFMGNGGSAESGGGTGSDFVIYSTNDTGGGLAAPFTIKRSSGVVTLQGAPTMTILPNNATNDAGAAAGGVPVGGVYRNGSVMMVRTV